MLIVPIIALHQQADNTILLSVRQSGKQLAGFYEFPGGKTEKNELPCEALVREIFEELDIQIEIQNLMPVIFADFRFENREYLLLMYYCNQYKGNIIGKEGQKIEFVRVDKLVNYKMPPANFAMIPILTDFIKKHLKKLD